MASVGRLSETLAEDTRVSAYLPVDAGARPPSAEVSVGGVLLLSTMAVVLAILGAMLLAATMLGVWWLISHIPVPPVMMRLLATLHLA